MSATLLLVALLLGQAQPAKIVTEAEKKEFLELLAKLPTRGEFFTEEAVKKAAPYTRVLLALTEKDLETRRHMVSGSRRANVHGLPRRQGPEPDMPR